MPEEMTVSDIQEIFESIQEYFYQNGQLNDWHTYQLSEIKAFITDNIERYSQQVLGSEQKSFECLLRSYLEFTMLNAVNKLYNDKIDYLSLRSSLQSIEIEILAYIPENTFKTFYNFYESLDVILDNQMGMIPSNQISIMYIDQIHQKIIYQIEEYRKTPPNKYVVQKLQSSINFLGEILENLSSDNDKQEITIRRIVSHWSDNDTIKSLFELNLVSFATPPILMNDSFREFYYRFEYNIEQQYLHFREKIFNGDIDDQDDESISNLIKLTEHEWINLLHLTSDLIDFIDSEEFLNTQYQSLKFKKSILDTIQTLHFYHSYLSYLFRINKDQARLTIILNNSKKIAQYTQRNTDDFSQLEERHFESWLSSDVDLEQIDAAYDNFINDQKVVNDINSSDKIVTHITQHIENDIKTLRKHIAERKFYDDLSIFENNQFIRHLSFQIWFNQNIGNQETRKKFYKKFLEYQNLIHAYNYLKNPYCQKRDDFIKLFVKTIDYHNSLLSSLAEAKKNNHKIPHVRLFYYYQQTIIELEKTKFILSQHPNLVTNKILIEFDDLRLNVIGRLLSYTGFLLSKLPPQKSYIEIDSILSFLYENIHKNHAAPIEQVILALNSSDSLEKKLNIVFKSFQLIQKEIKKADRNYKKFALYIVIKHYFDYIELDLSTNESRYSSQEKQLVKKIGKLTNKLKNKIPEGKHKLDNSLKSSNLESGNNTTQNNIQKREGTQTSLDKEIRNLISKLKQPQTPGKHLDKVKKHNQYNQALYLLKIKHKLTLNDLKKIDKIVRTTPSEKELERKVQEIIEKRKKKIADKQSKTTSFDQIVKKFIATTKKRTLNNTNPFKEWESSDFNKEYDDFQEIQTFEPLKEFFPQKNIEIAEPHKTDTKKILDSAAYLFIANHKQLNKSNGNKHIQLFPRIFEEAKLRKHSQFNRMIEMQKRQSYGWRKISHTINLEKHTQIKQPIMAINGQKTSASVSTQIKAQNSLSSKGFVNIFDAKTGSMTTAPESLFLNSLNKAYGDGSSFNPINPNEPFKVYNINKKNGFITNTIKNGLAKTKSFYSNPMTHREASFSKIAGVYFMIKMSIHASIYTRAIYDNEIKKIKGSMTTEEAAMGLSMLAVFSGLFYLLEKASTRLAGHVGIALMTYELFSFMYNNRKELFSEFYRENKAPILQNNNYRQLIKAIESYKELPSYTRGKNLWNIIQKSNLYSTPLVRLRLSKKKPIYYEAFQRQYSVELDHYKLILKPQIDKVKDLKKITVEQLANNFHKPVIIKYDGHLAYPHPFANEIVLSIPHLHYKGELYRPKEIGIIRRNGKEVIYKAQYLNAWNGLESDETKAELTKVLTKKPIIVSPAYKRTSTNEILLNNLKSYTPAINKSGFSLWINLYNNTIGMRNDPNNSNIYYLTEKNGEFHLSTNSKRKISAYDFLKLASSKEQAYNFKNQTVTLDSPELQRKQKNDLFQKNKKSLIDSSDQFMKLASYFEDKKLNHKNTQSLEKMFSEAKSSMSHSDKKKLSKIMISILKSLSIQKRLTSDKNMQDTINQILYPSKSNLTHSPIHSMLTELKNNNKHLSVGKY